MTCQHPRRWKCEVQPPHREGECGAAAGDENDLGRPTRQVDDSRDREDSAKDHLAECDDPEQRVPFSDVVRMPRGPAVLALGEERT
jgi:hypothetical protein